MRSQHEEEEASAVMRGYLGCFQKGLGLLSFVAADVIKIGYEGQTWHRPIMAAPRRSEKKDYMPRASLDYEEKERRGGREEEKEKKER